MIEIYTDGSCWPNDGTGPGGWAFVVFEDGKEAHSGWGSSARSTNNKMELMGMLQALVWLGARPGSLFSDSKYVVDGLNSWCAGWQRRGWMRKEKGCVDLKPVANVELWQEAYAARRHNHRVQWVRGHNGTLGNERADELAEAARMRETR